MSYKNYVYAFIVGCFLHYGEVYSTYTQDAGPLEGYIDTLEGRKKVTRHIDLKSALQRAQKYQKAVALLKQDHERRKNVYAAQHHDPVKEEEASWKQDMEYYKRPSDAMYPCY